MGLGALLLVIVVVRSCGGDAEDERVEAESGDAIPRTSIAVKIPAPQWQGQYPPAQPQAHQAPAYPQQQQPAYGYPAQQQQQPAYGYPAQQQQQPAYGYPAQQQQQPAYGYPAQQLQQQRQLPATDPGNPWAVQQPAYSYGAQPPQTQQWGQTRRQPPVYSQPPGSGQYRPLDEKSHRAQQSRSAAAVRPAAPYDRRAGSSFGGDGSSYPNSGAYPGYYGGTPYGGAYGGGWSGGGLGYPGAGWPGYR
jgi:hypothetical protein